MSPLPSAGTSFLSPSLTEVTHPSGERATPRGDDSLAMRARTTPASSTSSRSTISFVPGRISVFFFESNPIPSRTINFFSIRTRRIVSGGGGCSRSVIEDASLARLSSPERCAPPRAYACIGAVRREARGRRRPTPCKFKSSAKFALPATAPSFSRPPIDPGSRVPFLVIGGCSRRRRRFERVRPRGNKKSYTQGRASPSL